jgi:hypothetical protein
LRNETNQKTAQITSSTSSGTVTVVYRSGNTTCTGYINIPVPGGSVPNCSLPGLDDQMQGCVLGSDFFRP